MIADTGDSLKIKRRARPVLHRQGRHPLRAILEMDINQEPNFAACAAELEKLNEK